MSTSPPEEQGPAPQDRPSPAAPGSVADEARRLVEALRTRPGLRTDSSDAAACDPAPGAADVADADAASAGPGVDEPRERPHAGHHEPGPRPEDGAQGHPDGTDPGGGAGCRGCPWCTARRVVAGAGPETLQAAADVLALGANGLRALADLLGGEASRRREARPRPADVAPAAAPDAAPDAADPPASTGPGPHGVDADGPAHDRDAATRTHFQATPSDAGADA